MKGGKKEGREGGMMGPLVVVWYRPPVPQLVHQQAAQPGHMLPGLLPLLPLSSVQQPHPTTPNHHHNYAVLPPPPPTTTSSTFNPHLWFCVCIYIVYIHTHTHTVWIYVNHTRKHSRGSYCCLLLSELIKVREQLLLYTAGYIKIISY